MSSPQKTSTRPAAARAARPEPPRPETKTPPPAPTHPGEIGWLPDCVYTGDKFETGLAFFADALGRITRFSREPADLAQARRLAGQAALPGLVNVHSVSWQRVLRGRTEQPGKGAPLQRWREAAERAAAQMSTEAVFETARMAFTEMLLAGITCVGEFHALHRQPNGLPWPEPGAVAREILRAAHEVGIRIALFNVATLRAGFGQPASSAPAQFGVGSAEEFVQATEALRTEGAGRYAADEAWLGVAPESLATVPLDAFKVIASYAHAQRFRLQTRVAETRDDVTACAAEYGKTAVALLADHGIVDKRFTALHGNQLSADEARLLGAARATVCSCPLSERNLALAPGPIPALLEGGAGVTWGTGTGGQMDLLKAARLVEYDLRAATGERPALAGDAARTLFHCATVAGARALGSTGGALEVGRPADFFTVGLYDPSIAGADPDTLLANVVFALERRAIRDVWIGARQRIEGGRHPNQGPIVGRFVEVQRRLWGAT